MIPIHKIENFSGAKWLHVYGVPVIKNRDFFVDDTITIGGDAPKKFIGVYDYELMNHTKKAHKGEWPRFIAKTGHKWYPSESITEYLFNKLGEIFGLTMAESKLAMINGQLRFLSKYFRHGKDEELVHGADIIAGYLNESSEYIEEIDKQGLTRDLLTLQLIDKAVYTMFPNQKASIMCSLIKLLIFDAVVGNNDRHFFNWGIIKSIKDKFPPYFAPIYDTARGLFWNNSDESLQKIVENGIVESKIKKYCNGAHPKVGWENFKNPNHFQLLTQIYNTEFYITKDEVKKLADNSTLQAMLNEIDKNFVLLMSPTRRELIKECLKYRFTKIKEIIYEKIYE